jgi:hypothetical protein
MSAFGDKADMATSQHNVRFTRKADIAEHRRYVRFVPISDIRPPTFT